METKRFKVQKTVSVQTVQRALNDTRRWSETIAHFKKKKFKFSKLKL